MDLTTFTDHRRIVATSYGPLAYVDVGEGPPAVFVHGVFTSSALWRKAIADVVDLRRCIAIDMPAHGRSVTTTDQDLSLHGQATAVAAICDALDLDDIDLVANDTGGAVAQVFAAARPDRVRTLTLTNCDAHDNIPPAAFRAAVEMARSGDLAPFMASMAADHDVARGPAGFGLGYEHPDQLASELLDEYLQCAATLDRGREIERLITSIEPEPLLRAEHGLGRLAAPAAIVWGTGDVFFEPAWAYWLADLLPDATVSEVPGAKLFFPDERPAPLVHALRRLWATT